MRRSMADAWARDSARRIAARFRILMRDALLPQLGTRDRLIAELSDALIAAAKGEWGGLLAAEPDAPIRPRLRARVRSMLLAVVTAIVPIGTVVGLGVLGYSLPGQLNGIATALSGLWAAVTVLFAFDPKFEAKVATMKDIASMAGLSARGRTPGA